MRILITGGAGYIGSHIAEEFIEKHEIFVVDDLSTGFKKFLSRKIKFYKFNVRKTSELKKINQCTKIEI